MEKSFDQVYADLAMLLRDHPAGTTADLTDWTLAYWDGHRISGVFLSADNAGTLDEEFEFNADIAGRIQSNIEDWFKSPRYTWRAELVDRLKDAPPFESGELESP